eukprot:scaffold943_cov409-Pavlova_lutheri.AAC.4
MDTHWEQCKSWDAWYIPTQKLYIPSWVVVVDEESGPGCCDLDRNTVDKELTSMGDGRTGVSFSMEAVEDAEVMKTESLYTKYGTTIATTLQLTQLLFGSGRVCLRARSSDWWKVIVHC